MNTAAAARGLGVGVFVFTLVLGQVARGEVYEVALPLGEYRYQEQRNFSFDLGTELSEVHSVAFRSAGTIIAPLGGSYPGPYTTPINGVLITTLLGDGPVAAAALYSPVAGATTYPEPEPFAGVDSAPGGSWSSFLLDGKADGFVRFGKATITSGAGGGLGVLTTATLVIDATPVPEPGVAAMVGAGAALLLRRRRGRTAAAAARGARFGVCMAVVVSVVALSPSARAEVFEVPLPLGEYRYLERRNFSFDLGTEFSEIHSVQFRSAGTMVAPLGGSYPGPYTTPVQGAFIATLFTDGPLAANLQSPVAGAATYPEPEPFAGVDTSSRPTWPFLLDGKADGYVRFAHGSPTSGASGGLGVLTTATLVIDATPVPEAGVGALVCVGAVGLLRRRRWRRC